MTVGRTYLDWNATAPLRPEAREAMLCALELTGNPSSVHTEGRRARALVETAREEIAGLLNAKPSEIVFTSGATEANVWAVSRARDVLTVAGIEHDSIIVPARASDAHVIELAVSRSGAVEIEAVRVALQAAAATGSRPLVLLQMANNETGVLQPVAEAAALAAEYGASLHTDAVQAAGREAIDFRALGAATLSLSSHKIGGPMGAGALVVRDGVEIPALLMGGGQERRRRGGTENVPAIAGFGAAAKAATRDLVRRGAIRALRDRLEAGVLEITPDAVIAGREAPRLDNTSCIALSGQSAETLVIKLDLAGVAVSAGAACSSGKVGASRTLLAMGMAPELARGAVRVSIGAGTSETDIAAFLDAWKTVARKSVLAA